MFMIKKTPIEQITWQGIDCPLYIKRDDLIGFSFGGNKARIVWEFYEDMKRKGCDAMVIYGSSRSNLCRAASNLCASEHIPCHMITAEEDMVEGGTFNSLLAESFGAKIHVCQKDKIGETVENLMENLRQCGYCPYYIYGDKYGRGNERPAALAYEKAYLEILEAEKELGVRFRQIFHASGTGMTQGGLLAGQKRYGGDGEIVGISVARAGERGKAEVMRFAGEGVSEEKLHFLDGYLRGGYGRYDEAVENVIDTMMKENGIALDPVYTGKAFAGMIEELKERQKKEPGRKEPALFIHTGGGPLYFEYLRRR